MHTSQPRSGRQLRMLGKKIISKFPFHGPLLFY